MDVMEQDPPQIIAIVGPESTGKTTLSRELAIRFNSSFVPEFAREFLNQRYGKYSQADLLTIANGQLKLEQAAIDNNSSPIFCDTDVVVIMVWHEFKYANQSHELETIFRKQYPRKYLLTYPDIPWQNDPLRENPQDLKAIFNLYVNTLERIGADYSIIKGIGDSRLKLAIDILS